MSATIDLSWLNKLASEAQLPLGTTLTVIDRNGTILSRYPEPEVWSGKTLPDVPIIKTILSHPGEGTAESFGVDGTHRFYAYKRLYRDSEGEDIYIYSGIPASFVLASANTILNRNLAFIVVLSVLFFVMTWKGGDLFIVRRLKSLLTATEKLASGDRGARSAIPYEAWEIGKLGQSFDNMPDILEKRTSQYIQSEELLKRYHLLSKHNRDIILFIRYKDGLILEANSAALEAYGYEQKELLQKTIFELRVQGSESIAQSQMAEALAKGILFEAAHCRKDGSTFPVEVSSIGVKMGDDEILLSIIRDITTRKQVQVELQKERDFSAAIFETVAAMVVVLNREGNIVLFNQTFEMLTGFSSSEARDRKVWDFLAVFETTGTATTILEEDGTVSLSNAEFVNLILLKPVPTSIPHILAER